MIKISLFSLILWIFCTKFAVSAENDIKKFAYLKGKDSNIRNGPGEDYLIIRTYTNTHMPLAIMHRIDNWYMISDYKNQTGWIRANLLSFNSKNRKVIFIKSTNLCRFPSKDNCQILSEAKKDSVAQVLACNKNWCRVRFSSLFLSGWSDKNAIWGVFSDEII